MLRRLGRGQFSTVYLAKDTDDAGGRKVALKIIKSANEFMEAAMDEIGLLDNVRGYAKDLVDDDEGRKQGAFASRLVTFHDWFWLEGPNGRHIVMSFEPLGPNLLTVLRRSPRNRLPSRHVKYVLLQLLQALAFLHDTCNIIHTDVKPENVITVPVPVTDLSSPLDAEVDGPRIKLADLGNACHADRLYTTNIQTRHYRAPEILRLRRQAKPETGVDTDAAGRGAIASTAPSPAYDAKVDIWSCGCLLYELATGEWLLDPKGREGDPEKDERHLNLIASLFGDAEGVVGVAMKRRLRDRGVAEAELGGMEMALRRMLKVGRKERAGAREMIGDGWFDDVRGLAG
ncbi:hypothetical protein HK101_001072 [Irineochytrium annulatum]|nr:hypothetical protein HK101_001072 [Irineochytrium annulatum]